MTVIWEVIPKILPRNQDNLNYRRNPRKQRGKINIEELLKRIDEDSCKIEKIPQSRKRKEKNLPSEVCKAAHQRKNKSRSASHTLYWCETHSLPACLAKCYDIHKINIMKDFIGKKRKLN